MRRTKVIASGTRSRRMPIAMLVGAAGAMLFGATAHAASPASIVITGALTSLANTCTPTGNQVSVVVAANEGAAYSDNFVVTAPGFAGYTWASGENGPFPGTSYGFSNASVWGINVPANTPVTSTIYVYNGNNLTGGRIYSSAITWDCTTGTIASIVNTDLSGGVTTTTPVPTLSGQMMYVLGALVAAMGLVLLRRRA